MLSKLFHSAIATFRNQSTENSQAATSQTEKEEEGTSTSPDTSAMVTTRRQSSNQAALAQLDGAANTVPEESPAVKESTPRSRKRRRGEVTDASPNAKDENTPTKEIDTAKRQKNLPVRSKDDGEKPDFESHTHMEVEIPVSQLAGNKDLEEAAGDEAEDVEDNEGEAQEEQDEQEQEIPGEQEKEKEEQVAEEPKPGSKSKHKRFDDTDAIEPEPELAAAAADTHDNNDAEASESDDDDAPEEVGASTAQAQALESARAAAKALEERDALARTKRKDRDAQLKKQAKAAAGKRRRENYTDNIDAYVSDEEQDGGVATTATTDDKPRKHNPKKSKPAIPAVLPLEYLTDSEPEGEEEEDLSTSPAKPKKTKFPSTVTHHHLLKDTKPKDLTLGNTTYRVAEKSAKGLAPKAAVNARNVKESWLAGMRGPAAAASAAKKGKGSGFGVMAVGGAGKDGGMRKVANRGFLVRR